MPATIEERVAYLEGKVEEHSSAWQDIREHLIHLEQKIDQRFIQIDQRFNETNQRIDKLYLLIIGTLVSSIGSLIAAIVSIII